MTVVTCTLGEEGEVIPVNLRGLESSQADQLGGYRVNELRSACGALGVTDHRFLGGIGHWRDSGMVWQQRGKTAAAAERLHPRALVAGDVATQTRQLEAILRELKPQVVVSYAADGGYGHPDHIRAHDLTMAATAEVEEVSRVFHAVPSADAVTAGLADLAEIDDIPFTVPHPDELPAVPDDSITTVLDVTAHLPAKISALKSHRTQVEVWLDRWNNASGTAAYALSNGIAQPIVSTEHYVLARGDRLGAESDLFGGLGIVGAEWVQRG